MTRRTKDDAVEVQHDRLLDALTELESAARRLRVSTERELAICENVVEEILQAHIDQMDMSGIIMRTRQDARDEKPDMAECFSCGMVFSSVENVADLIARERAAARAEGVREGLEMALAICDQRAARSIAWRDCHARGPEAAHEHAVAARNCARDIRALVKPGGGE